MNNDPYAALGVTKTATDAEIKKAYRKIARKSHPDLNPDDTNAEARFKAASAAYDLLKDPENRAKFDRGEIDATGAEKQSRQYYHKYAEAADNPYRPQRPYDDAVDPADLFGEFLRRGRAGPSDGQEYDFSAPGPDHRFSLEVSFLDAVNGVKTRVTLPDGSSLEVKIPQGTADGQTIRLRGKGGPGIGGGPSGNALVTLSVRPDSVFQRDGNDILVVLPITIDTAVLGGKVEVPTIGGSVKLTIPKGANSGQTLRLRGRGVKPAGKEPGDQKVELRIVMPPDIDPELAEFMQIWRKKNAYDPAKADRK